MYFRYMKITAISLILMAMLSGCLMTGSPLYFKYRSVGGSRSDSGYLVSYPGKHLQYRLPGKGIDSLFIAALPDVNYQKATLEADRKTFSYNFRSNTSNVKKQVASNSRLYIRKYKHRQVLYDTLAIVPKPQ